MSILFGLRCHWIFVSGFTYIHVTRTLAASFETGTSSFRDQVYDGFAIMDIELIPYHLSIDSIAYRVRNYRGRVSNFNQSEARKHCFLASDWSKFETLPR